MLYCFVEKSGERSFVSYHGAEYLFEKSWFDLIDVSEIDSVYICGLEIEEKTGINIVEFLEKNPQLTVFFAPDPRLTVIDPALTERIYKLSPVLHLNETEALEVSGETDISKAGAYLYRKTHNTVIITLGEKGCYYYNGKKEEIIAPIPTIQADTIGAGDSHIGSVIACLKKGDSIPIAISKANRVSSAVVATSSALLPDEDFRRLNI